MYRLKTATINDVEEIWQIIGKTWLDTPISGTARAALIDMLNTNHAVKKIESEILNQHQYYLIVIEEDTAVAFASYSLTGATPPDFRIHKIYCIPSVQGKGYNNILLKHIEELACQLGSKHLSVTISENVKKAYFEALGFIVNTVAHAENSTAQKGFEMIKNL